MHKKTHRGKAIGLYVHDAFPVVNQAIADILKAFDIDRQKHHKVKIMIDHPDLSYESEQEWNKESNDHAN